MEPNSSVVRVYLPTYPIQVRVHDASTGLGWTTLVFPKNDLDFKRDGGWPLGTNQPSIILIQARI